MPTDWIEITAKGPRESSTEAADVLINAGSPGVLEEDSGSSSVGKLLSHSSWDSGESGDSSGSLDEIGPPSHEATYKAYLPPDEPEKIERVKKDLKKLGWAFSTAFFKDQDWSVKWRAGLKPVRITAGGSSIVVKPSWCASVKRPGDIIIEIDPGMAFGTGGHATTKMCLKAIKTLLKNNKGLSESLLDVGTGTGILAIAARKLKVRRAVGTDIDRVALKVARKNVRLNKTNISLSARPVEKVPGEFSIVVANILAGALIKLSKPLFDKVSPGGCLVLSGILREESDQVKDAFVKTGLKHTKTFRSGEWAALVFNKKAHIR